MNLFSCPLCDNQLYFESYECNECNVPLGYLLDHQQLFALEERTDGTWGAIGGPSSLGSLRYCKNQTEASCNWLVSADQDEEYCASCRLTTELPDLSVAPDKNAWAELERAKRRVLCSLKSLSLPIESHAERKGGLKFRLLKGTQDNPVLTGHDQGTITINVAEANDSYREAQRERMGESYRTPLGHFRHEIGHYYFDRLVQDSSHIDEFRQLFGDERSSYEQALKRHYEHGAPDDYAEHYISAYATMHPWEDWAETWAHYLHIVDTLETAQSYGIAVAQPTTGSKLRVSSVDLNEFDVLMKAWIPVTLAVNGMNRSMGLADAYPFAISPTVQKKLAFVHRVIQKAQDAQEASPPGHGPSAPVETMAS